MVDTTIIRKYRPEDRPSVREISCDTADRGEPVDRLFGDREIAADILTRYYTDFEPGCLWVAESGGEVRGYLTGCLDSGRYYRSLAWSLLPRILIKALCRGAFLREETWTFFLSGMKIYLTGRHYKCVGHDKYPAHLHVNVLKGSRGQGIGRRLVERFLEQAAAARVRGVHVSVREGNMRGRKFFESMGFVELGRYPTAYNDIDTREEVHVVVYGKGIGDGSPHHNQS